MLSIIIPVYNEKDNLPLLYSRLVSVFKAVTDHSFEIVFVDDCSTDGTSEVLRELAEKDQRVQIIRFSRNFGSHAAVSAGLQFCRGEAAIMIAADLQDPPEIIPELLAKWEEGFKIVWGVRSQRKREHLTTLVFSRLFYFLMNHLTDIRQSPTGADVFMIDRTAIEAFKQAREKNTSVYMLIAWLGFSQAAIEYIKEGRHSGKSKWGISERLKLFLDSLISFSYIPLRLMSLVGAMTALLGLIYGLIVFINALSGNPVQGWSFLMMVILLIGGFQMIMMGVLGEYLWRIYDESRRRPKYVVEKNTLLEREPSAPH